MLKHQQALVKGLVAACKKVEITNKLDRIILFQSAEKKKIFRKGQSQDASKKFSCQEEMHFQKMDLDELFSLDSKKNQSVHLMLA